MKKGGKLLCLFIALGAICCKPIIYEDDSCEIVTINGRVLDTEKAPLDSVEISNFKNEVMTYSNNEGYFEIKEELRILHQYVLFQKEGYIRDTIQYYINIERLGGYKPCLGLDTIVLKKEIKAN
jgi:hypothetical protein